MDKREISVDIAKTVTLLSRLEDENAALKEQVELLNAGIKQIPNPETQIKIAGHLVNVAGNGLSPLEMRAIVVQVEERMKQIGKETAICDTGKLCALAAYDFALELYNLKQKSEVSKICWRHVDSLLAEMLVNLQLSRDGKEKAGHDTDR